jgi:hypothetical protein
MMAMKSLKRRMQSTLRGLLNNGKFFENRIRNVLILKKVEIQKQAILVIIQQALEVKYANT